MGRLLVGREAHISRMVVRLKMRMKVMRKKKKKTRRRKRKKRLMMSATVVRTRGPSRNKVASLNASPQRRLSKLSLHHCLRRAVHLNNTSSTTRANTGKNITSAHTTWATRTEVATAKTTK